MEIKTSRVPSLPDLWIDVSGDVVARVDCSHNCGVHERGIRLQGVLKHDLQVAVEGEVEVSLILVWGCAVELNESLGKLLGSARLIGPEIKGAAWVGSDTVDPGFEVNFSQDFIYSFGVAGDGFDEIREGLSHRESINAGECIVIDVIGEEVLHQSVPKNVFLDVSKHLEPFLVGNFRERVVRIVAQENRVDARVSVVNSESLNGVVKRGVSEERFSVGKVSVVELIGDVAFEENGESFVKEEVLPVVGSDFVTSPGVTDFVDSHVSLRLVSNDDRGRGECEQRIFHSAHGEGGRHDHDGVIAPDVRGLNISLSDVKICLQIGKLGSALCELAWLSDNTSGGANRLISKLTDGDSHQVVRDGNRVVEAVLVIAVDSLVSARLVGTHVRGKLFVDSDARAVSDAVGGRVLKRRH